MCDSIRTTKSTVKPFALSDQRELEVIALDGEIRKHVVFFLLLDGTRNPRIYREKKNRNNRIQWLYISLLSRKQGNKKRNYTYISSDETRWTIRNGQTHTQ
jgi:hypothetical protein